MLSKATLNQGAPSQIRGRRLCVLSKAACVQADGRGAGRPVDGLTCISHRRRGDGLAK